MEKSNVDTVRIRNNSGSIRTLPRISDTNGKVQGPRDTITIRPGEIVEVEVTRLRCYDSPSFRMAFTERGDRRADLEVVTHKVTASRPLAPHQPVASLVERYDNGAGQRKIDPTSASNMGAAELEERNRRRAAQAARAAAAQAAPKIDEVVASAPQNAPAPTSNTSPVDVVA